MPNNQQPVSNAWEGKVTIPPVPFIDKSLGGSPFYEENRGDFAQARQRAEQQLVSARQRGDRPQVADALLARGIVHLLQGEPAAALACLEEVHEKVPDDPGRRLRALSYAYQAMQLNYNFWPNGGVATSRESIARGNLLEYATQYSQRKDPLQAQIQDPALDLEEHLLITNRGFLGIVLSGYLHAINPRRAAANYVVEHCQQAEEKGTGTQALGILNLRSADALFKIGENKAASEALERAATLYRQSGDVLGEANVWMMQGDVQAAPASTPLVWNCCLHEGIWNSALHWKIEALEADTHQIKPSEARQMYAQAKQLYRTGGALRGMAALELRFGYLETLECNYPCAAEHAMQARELFTATGDILGVQVAQAHYALCQIGMRPFPEDKATAEAIGLWGRTTGSLSFSLGLGLFFLRVGRRWLMRDGDYERALACFRLAEALFRNVKMGSHQIQSMADQSTTYEMLGEHDAFVTSVEHILEMCNTLIASQSTLARSVWEQAAWMGLRLLEIANKRAAPDMIKRVSERLQGLLQMAPLNHQAQMDSDDAEINMPDKATPEQVAMTQFIAWHLRTELDLFRFLEPLYRGKQAYKAGDQAQADHWFSRAHEVMLTCQSRDSALMESQLAGFQRQFAEAAAAFRRYVENERARITRQQGISGGLMQDVMRIQVPDGERSRLQLALLSFTRFKCYAEAEIYLKALEQMDGPEWWRIDGPAWVRLADCGEIYEGLERWTESFECYDRAIANFEQQRGQLTVAELKAALASDSTAQRMYFNAARTALKAREAALAAGDTQAATAAVERSVHYIEQGKARSLLDLMADGLMLDNAPPSESQALREWRRLHAYLATRRGLLAHERAQQTPDPEWITVLNQEIATAEANLRTVDTELATADPRLYRAQQAQSTVLSLAEIRAQLPLDTALLQYAFLDDDLLAWAITRGGLAQVHRTTFEVRWLEQAIRAFHRGCEMPHGAFGDVGQKLANWLLEPLGRTIAAYKRLIVVPYGAAHSLPFHALPWQGQPLAETHVLSYLPSASAASFLATPDLTSPQPVLAIGDPTAMAWRKPGTQEAVQANPLPCAAVEATYVASLFSGSRALIREQATAAAVSTAIPAYRRLHFATHGLLSEDVPLLSSILLANGEALSVYDLMGLRMDADLVVLSACRTAQGETTAGDDVLGLTRGLLAAGVRAAVVTLWPVDDAATSLLMGEFYRQLQAGKVPSLALQQAQHYLRKLPSNAIAHELEQLRIDLQHAGAREATLQILAEQHAAYLQPRNFSDGKSISGKADYSHPYYWAPFVLIGL